MPAAHISQSVESFPIRRIPTAELDRLPFVSVIVPVRNEAGALGRTLDCLRAQDYPYGRMEIIVADGMSTDCTRRIVSLAAAIDPRIRLIDNSSRIMAAGFNLALQIARGDVIIMMGGHTELATDYLQNCVFLLQQGVADCVGGPITTTSETPEAEAISLAMSSRFGVGGVAFRVGCRQRKYVDTVPFGAYTREILNRAGPLDEELVRGQDSEFNYRLRKLGGKILIAPEIRSRYQCRSSLPSLGRQYFQYGKSKVRILQKHPRQMQWRHFVPAAFVCSLLLSLGIALVRPFVGVPLLLVLSVPYLVAMFAVSLSLAVRRGKWRLVPALAMAFPILHFSYGGGFLLGLAKFRNCWHGFWEALTGKNTGSPGPPRGKPSRKESICF